MHRLLKVAYFYWQSFFNGIEDKYIMLLFTRNKINWTNIFFNFIYIIDFVLKCYQIA